jgi:hypothetical protein
MAIVLTSNFGAPRSQLLGGAMVAVSYCFYLVWQVVVVVVRAIGAESAIGQIWI